MKLRNGNRFPILVVEWFEYLSYSLKDVVMQHEQK